jgi:predicted porin
VNGTNNPFGLIFDRQATVGLESSTMGKFDMGWNYTTSYTVIQSYDPFNYKFNAIALAKGAADQDRAGNVIYQIKLGDINLMAEYDINNAYGGSEALKLQVLPAAARLPPVQSCFQQLTLLAA